MFKASCVLVEYHFRLGSHAISDIVASSRSFMEVQIHIVFKYTLTVEAWSINRRNVNIPVLPSANDVMPRSFQLVGTCTRSRFLNICSRIIYAYAKWIYEMPTIYSERIKALRCFIDHCKIISACYSQRLKDSWCWVLVYVICGRS
jgi:hypothetical protein